MKNSTHKWGRPYKRKLHIRGEEWSWRAFGFNIDVRSPSGKRTISFDSYELHDTTQEEWYADTDSGDEFISGSNEPQILPSDVKRFVEEVIDGKRK